MPPDLQAVPADRPGWTPAASLDLASRRGKARKIAALLSAWTALEGADVLEVGAGAGVTAAVLAVAVGPAGSVTAVDVEDLRVVTDGYRFELVSGTRLPFAAGSFSVVISNLVVEHVGGFAEQQHHLDELRRVLRPGGAAYLALPNRWAPVEPHFGVPLLTWLPARWRTPCLRATGRAEVFDIRPLARREVVAMLRRAGFVPVDRTLDAMRVMAREESPWLGTRLALRTPAWLVRALRVVLPTYVFEARVPPDPDAGRTAVTR